MEISLPNQKLIMATSRPPFNRHLLQEVHYKSYLGREIGQERRELCAELCGEVYGCEWGRLEAFGDVAEGESDIMARYDVCGEVGEGIKRRP